MEIKPNNIYLGDSYELIKSIPDKSVDLIITDPPYEMASGGNGHKEMALRFRKRYEELKKEKLDVGMELSFLNELERVCKNIYIYMVQQKSIIQVDSLLFTKRRYKPRYHYLG